MTILSSMFLVAPRPIPPGLARLHLGFPCKGGVKAGAWQYGPFFLPHFMFRTRQDPLPLYGCKRFSGQKPSPSIPGQAPSSHGHLNRLPESLPHQGRRRTFQGFLACGRPAPNKFESPGAPARGRGFSSPGVPPPPPVTLSRRHHRRRAAFHLIERIQASVGGTPRGRVRGRVFLGPPRPADRSLPRDVSY